MPKPPSVICYICQREFGTASIGIHEKSCLKRWHDENNNLPKNQRRPEPVKPQMFQMGTQGGQVIKTTGVDSNIDAYNAAAVRTAIENLIPCRKCGRRFNQDKIRTHENYCKPTNPKKPVYEARKPDFDVNILRTPLSGIGNGPSSYKASPNSAGQSAARGGGSPGNNFPRCIHCNRTFAPDRIDRHQENCHATPLGGEKPRQQNKTPQFGQSYPVTVSQTDLKKTTSSQIKCSSCFATMASNSKFCASCGTPSQIKCSACKSDVPSGAKFCSKCGKPVQVNKNNEDNAVYFNKNSEDSFVSFQRPISKRRKSLPRPTIVCYICGNEYGLRSISIHEPQCFKKWSYENERLPIHRRLPLPKKPFFTSDKDLYNRAAGLSSRLNMSLCDGFEQKNVKHQLPFYVRQCMPDV